MNDLQVGKYPSWYKLWEEIAKTTKKMYKKLTEEQFNDACDRYRKILRETEGNWEERKRRINEFRCGGWL